MTCSQTTSLFSTYYDEVLESEAKAAFAIHLQNCPECAAQYNKYKILFDEIHGLPQPVMPEGFHEKMMAAIPPKKAFSYPFYPGLWAKVGGAAAACFIMLSLLVSGAAWLITESAIRKTSGSTANAHIATVVEPDTNAIATPFYFVEIGKLVTTLPNHELSALNVDSSFKLAKEYYEQHFEISIKVDDIQKTVEAINQLDGYNLQADTSYNENSGSAKFQRRIRVDDYVSTQNKLRQLGEITYETERIVKRSDENDDLNARLKAKDEEVKRLLALLTQSHTMDVLTAVERQLGSAENERDHMRGRINLIYETSNQPLITITLTQNPPEPAPIPIATFSERLSGSFIGSLNACLRLMEETVVWLSGALVPLLLMAMFTVSAAIIVRRGRKGKGHE